MTNDLIREIQYAQMRAGEDAVIRHLKQQGLDTDDLDKGDPNAKVEPPMATFIQPKITGYRQLGKVEADLMNQAKALGAAFEALVSALRDYHRTQQTAAVNDDTELAWWKRDASWVQRMLRKLSLRAGT